MSKQNGVESKVREIRRKTHKRLLSRGGKSVSCLRACEARRALPHSAAGREIGTNLYYSWCKGFLEAGKRRLMGNTKRQATSGEVLSLRNENLLMQQSRQI